MGVDACYQALGCGFLVSCRSVDLACEVEIFDQLCLQRHFELCRRKIVVFDGVSRSEHPGVLESGYFGQCLVLYFFWEGRGEPVDVDFNGIPSFWFYEDLVAVAFRNPLAKTTEKIMFPSYDVIVVGAGHAGCEAAASAAKMG